MLLVWTKKYRKNKEDSLGGIHHTQTAVVATGESHHHRGCDVGIIICNVDGPGSVVWAEVAKQVKRDEEATQQHWDPHKPWTWLYTEQQPSFKHPAVV